MATEATNRATTKPEPERDTDTTSAAPTNVIEAIACVMADLPGIGKLSPEQRRGGQPARDGEERGVNYAYRSIEQITAEAQTLFAQYGVIFVPKVLAPSEPDPEVLKLLSEIVREGGPQLAQLAFDHLAKLTGGGQSVEREFTLGNRGTRWTDTYLTVTYTIYGPGGVDDHIEAGPFMVVGRDNSDKGFNKAMTQAYKQCLLQVLCVADPKEEGEHDRHLDEERTDNAPPPTRQTGGEPPPPPVWQSLGYVDQDELQSLNDSLKEMMGRVPENMAEQVGKAFDVLGYPKGSRLPVAKSDVEPVREALKLALDAPPKAEAKPKSSTKTTEAPDNASPDPEPTGTDPQGTLAEGEAAG